MQLDTVMRWLRDLMHQRLTRTCRPQRPGRRPPSAPYAFSSGAWSGKIRTGVPAGAWRARHPRYRDRPITVWEILKARGIDLAPQRGVTTWADFLRSQAETLLACDFFETVTLTGQRQYIVAVIEHANRRIRILGTTAHPTAGWVAQAIKNLVMDLEDAGCRAGYLILDRDGKFLTLIDAVLTNAGIQTVRCGVQARE